MKVFMIAQKEDAFSVILSEQGGVEGFYIETETLPMIGFQNEYFPSKEAALNRIEETISYNKDRQAKGQHVPEELFNQLRQLKVYGVTLTVSAKES